MNRAVTRADTLERSAFDLVVKNPLIMSLVGLMVGGIALGCWLG